MITRPKVTLNKISIEALSTCYYSSSPNKSFGDLNKLRDYKKLDPDFETLALNDFELDGSFNEDFRNVAFMSDTLSDQNCIFNNTWVRINFNNPQSMANLSMYFGERFPKKIKIEGYSEGSLIEEETIDNISSSTIYSSISFTRVDYIKVIFLESWSPYRYANLQYLLPGSFLEFSGDRISSLTLNESTDIISSKLEIDTAHLEVFKQKSEFNILDYNNLVKQLNKWDPANIEVEIEDNGIKRNVFLGTYYINKISTTSDEILVIDFVSLLGMMDEVEYISSGMAIDASEPLENINAKRVIDSIFDEFLNGIGIPQSDHYKYYEVESGIENLRTYGYIPKMSCREALQNVCFTNLLKVLDNRKSKISIKQTSIDSTLPIVDENQIITTNRILTSPEIEIQDKVKSISAKYNNISLSSEEATILTINREGLYIFDSPYEVTRVNMLTPDAQVSYIKGINYIKITHVSGPTTFTANVIGQKYNISNQDTLFNTSYNDGKSISISNSGMLTYFNTEEFISVLSEYYNENNLKLKFEYIDTMQETGELSKAIFNDNEFVGFLIHQDLDVSGGMVSRCEMIGYDWSSFN